jgi:hypothetical protein
VAVTLLVALVAVSKNWHDFWTLALSLPSLVGEMLAWTSPCPNMNKLLLWHEERRQRTNHPYCYANWSHHDFVAPESQPVHAADWFLCERLPHSSVLLRYFQRPFVQNPLAPPQVTHLAKYNNFGSRNR